MKSTAFYGCAFLLILDWILLRHIEVIAFYADITEPGRGNALPLAERRAEIACIVEADCGGDVLNWHVHIGQKQNFAFCTRRLIRYLNGVT